MPSMIVLQHPVADFEAWKQAFDSDPVGRVHGGVTRHAIYRPADDPGSVVVNLEFGTRRQAESFLPALRALWERVGDRIGFEAAGVQAQIVDEVERVDY